jgi:hypothetical protein
MVQGARAARNRAAAGRGPRLTALAPSPARPDPRQPGAAGPAPARSAPRSHRGPGPGPGCWWPWALGGGSVWRRRCGRVAARSVAARSRSVLGGGLAAGFRGRIWARARTWVVCGSFYEGLAVADDPVARRRPAPWAGPPGRRPGAGGVAEMSDGTRSIGRDRGCGGLPALRGRLPVGS